MGPLLKGLVLLGLGAGRGINFLQLADGEGRLLWVLPGVALVKIDQLRLAVPKFLDDQAHLQAPVAQMHVADHVVAQEIAQALDALADHGRAQMAHVQRLGHIGPTVVHDDGLRLFRLLQAQLLTSGHPLHVVRQELSREL